MGPDTNCAFASVYQLFSCSVFGSSATMAFEYALAFEDPAPGGEGPIAATTVPSVVKAMLPTGLPLPVFHETTGFASLDRSIAHTAFGAPPQLPTVDVYSTSLTARGSVHRAPAGK